MRILPNLLMLMGLASFGIGVCTKFFSLLIMFPEVSPISYVVVGNFFLLLALILKFANK